MLLIKHLSLRRPEWPNFSVQWGGYFKPLPQDGFHARYPHYFTVVPEVSRRVHSQESTWQIHLVSLVPWSRAGFTDRLGRGEGRWRRCVAPFCSLSNASRYCCQGVYPKPCSCGEGLSLWTGQRIPRKKFQAASSHIALHLLHSKQKERKQREKICSENFFLELEKEWLCVRWGIFMQGNASF